jgi:hypothetical protein
LSDELDDLGNPSAATDIPGERDRAVRFPARLPRPGLFRPLIANHLRATPVLR